MKVHNEKEREYYFIEIFDFTLNGFSEVDIPECDGSSWFAREFAPIKSYVVNGEADSISPRGIADSTTHAFVHEYLRLNSICKASLTVKKLTTLAILLTEPLLYGFTRLKLQISARSVQMHQNLTLAILKWNFQMCAMRERLL